MAALLVLALGAAVFLAWRGYETRADLERAVAAHDEQVIEDQDLVTEIEAQRLLSMGNHVVETHQAQLERLSTDDPARAGFRMVPEAYADMELPSGAAVARWLAVFPAPEGVHGLSDVEPCLGPYRTPLEVLRRPPWRTLEATPLRPGDVPSDGGGLRHTFDYRVVSSGTGLDARAIIAGVTDLRCDGRLEVFWTELSIEPSGTGWKVRRSSLHHNVRP